MLHTLLLVHPRLPAPIPSRQLQVVAVLSLVLVALVLSRIGLALSENWHRSLIDIKPFHQLPMMTLEILVPVVVEPVLLSSNLVRFSGLTSVEQTLVAQILHLAILACLWLWLSLVRISSA